MSTLSADSWRLAPPPPLGASAAHVWRVDLADDAQLDRHWSVLSAEEQGRARRFYHRRHRDRYVVAHGTLRRILASYAGLRPEALEFTTNEHGKPRLVAGSGAGASAIEFNLSHSDDLALVAVARDRAVGVDVERWSAETEHLDVAERFFSPAEREALRALAHEHDRIVEGFFAAWSRKEAYLKATGHGIARGLYHFDVTLTPGEPAQLLRDRLDASATDRWTMVALQLHGGFSAALVIASPLTEVIQLDVAALEIAPGRAPLWGLSA